MRPRINPACINTEKQAYSKERYTIQGSYPVIFFYHRDEAILLTTAVAVRKKTIIVIRLNGVKFCKIGRDGSLTWIYNPDKDYVTAPSLKKFFIERGYVRQDINIAVN